MLSPEYAAGFFDGEGCVNITVHGRSRQVSLRAMVVNTDADILALFRAHYGGTLTKPRSHQRGWKLFRSWQIRGRKARPFLESIRPFVRLKRAQIELALEFLDYMSLPRLSRCIVVPVPNARVRVVRTEETLARELSFKAKMHELNKKGVA